MARTQSNSLPAKGATVVLTGTSSGIGRATLNSLLWEGYTVFGSVRSEIDAEVIQAEVADLPGTYIPLVFDVTDASAIEEAASTVSSALKGATLGALINNAGMNVGTHPMELIPIAKLRYQLEVNLIAPVVISQAFLPLLGTDRSRQGPPGKLVFLGSIYGSYSLPWTGAYCATKHGLEAVSESFRIELRSSGIDVIIVRPGPTSSEIWRKSLRKEPDDRTDLQKSEDMAYSNSSYEKAMATTNAAMQAEMAKPGFFLPCHSVGDTICKAIMRKSPQAQIVITSRILINWILPRWLPVKLRDTLFAKKLGIS